MPAEIFFFITAGIKRKLSRKETDQTELLEMIERFDNRAEEKFQEREEIEDVP